MLRQQHVDRLFEIMEGYGVIAGGDSVTNTQRCLEAIRHQASLPEACRRGLLEILRDYGYEIRYRGTTGDLEECHYLMGQALTACLAEAHTVTLHYHAAMPYACGYPQHVRYVADVLCIMGVPFKSIERGLIAGHVIIRGCDLVPNSLPACLRCHYQTNNT